MWTRLPLLLCVTWASTVSHLLAQSGSLTPDEAAASNHAHRLQFNFERQRRSALPVLQPSGDTPCDERVGRLCYWHRESDSAITEPEAIARERDKLIDRLGRLVQRAPHDPWIIGQQVHYLVEGGYDSSAIVVARSCRSIPWWCAALRGFVFQDMQRYASAESAFDSALRAMPEAERCAWNDVSLLLTTEERRRYASRSCNARVEFERRFWQLADPSYLVPGNDRRTEHFARMVAVTLARDAQNTYGLTWGDDLRELIIRYGAPISYHTTWTSGTSFDRPVIGHDREPSYHFVAHASESDTARWELRAERARERYAPRYLAHLGDFAAQFAMFKRGDSALVIAVYPESKTTPNAAPSLGVIDPYTVTVTADTTGGPRVRRTRTTWRGVVVGIEQYDTVTRHLERTRSWLAPPAAAPGAPELSTVLLYDPVGDTGGVSTLDDAVRHALTTTEIGPRRQVGLYWEMYGAQRDSALGDSVHVNGTVADSAATLSITVVRTDGGIWRWLARSLRLLSRNAPLNIGWHDLPGTPGGVARAVVLDLSQLAAGRYRIELAAGPNAERRTVATRDIQLR